jgi:hypothetical protein
VKAVDEAAVGHQDVVVLVVKAYFLEQIAKDTQCLLDPEPDRQLGGRLYLKLLTWGNKEEVFQPR